ncbi:taste receptor type 2 member 7-like [Mantella aurantiaca]
MAYYPLLGFKLFVCVSCGLLGITSNLWIVGMNIRDVRRGLRLSPSDLILSLMGATNVILQSELSIDMAMIQSKCYDTYNRIHLTFIGVSIFLVSCNVWFTVWLSTYYCLKIVNFSKGILLFLKMRISHLLPRLLLVFVIESLCVAIPSYWSIYAVHSRIAFTNATLNSMQGKTHLVISLPYLSVTLIACVSPLLFTLAPIGVTLASLWRHVRRMRREETDSCRPRTTAHMRAARIMILLVTFHSAFCGASISFIFTSFNVVETAMFLSWYFALLYPTIQSTVIITEDHNVMMHTSEIHTNEPYEVIYKVMMGNKYDMPIYI